MPVPEGLVSGPPTGGHDQANQKEGLQDTPPYDKINLSEGEEVVLVPLYGLIHDSPVITAVQKITRKGRKASKVNDFVEETQWIDAMIVPFLEKIMAKIRKLEEDKK